RVARRIVLRLDRAEVARFSARLGPVRADTIWLGRGPRGKGAMDRGRFSGTLISQAMLWATPPGLESLPQVAAAPALYTETTDEPPTGAATGQLWIPASRDGAYLFVGPPALKGSGGPGWRWVPRVFVDRVQVERVVEFAARPPVTVEPVLVSGDDEAADGVYVRHQGPGRLAFG